MEGEGVNKMDAYELTTLALGKYGLALGEDYAFVRAVLDKGMTHDEAAAHVVKDRERLRREFPSFFNEDGTRK